MVTYSVCHYIFSSVIHLETKKGWHPKKRVRTVAKSEFRAVVWVQPGSRERIDCFPLSLILLRCHRRVGRLFYLVCRDSAAVKYHLKHHRPGCMPRIYRTKTKGRFIELHRN